MNDAQLGQIESDIIKIYLPGLNKGDCKKLRKMCKEKGRQIFNQRLQNDLKNIMASIIRHRETNYDQIVKKVGKERARFYIQPIINERLGA